MEAMKVVFPDKINLFPKHLETLKQLVELTTYDDVPNESQIIERIQGAEIITAIG